jgi:hypothetical protein
MILIKNLIKPFSQLLRFMQDFSWHFISYESINKSVTYSALRSVFDEKPEVITLLAHRISNTMLMHNSELWVSFNEILRRDSDLSTEEINHLLGFLREEKLQRTIFQQYLNSRNIDTKNMNYYRND